MIPLSSILLLLIAALAVVLIFQLFIFTQNRKKLLNQEEELKHRLYEVSILKSIGERIGYSLDLEKIVDIITGSLGNLFKYSMVSSLILKDGRVIFKSQLAEPVSQNFLAAVRGKMAASMTALLGQDFPVASWEENLSGVLPDEKNISLPASFFNIPLVINGKIKGLINISSLTPGLYKEGEMTILYKITSQASEAVAKLEKVLETEKGKLNAMVFSMADGVIMIDDENRISVINPTAKFILNLKGEINIFDLINSLSGKFDLREKLEDSKKQDKLVIVPEVSLRNNFLQVLISPVKNPEGEFLGNVILFHDITQEKRLNKIRQDFTAMMVHELRTPLTVIKSGGETIIAHISEIPPETLALLISSMKNSAEEMLYLVNDLLDAAKIEAGKFTVIPKAQEIIPLFQEIEQDFKPLATNKKIGLSFSYPPDLPKVTFDKERLRQVLNNLLSNALKFTEKGQVSLLAQKLDGQVLIAIQDTGRGINPDEKEKLFAPFSQILTPDTEKEPGTGLGLLISKGIVEAHGGKIDVDSKPGEGTTFSFNLPLLTQAQVN